jgi:transcriptional regulator with XRE-family HTH domain
MPRKSKLELPPLDLGPGTLGKRIARIRKEKGYTQVELAEKIGIIQALVSDYELDKLRPYYDVVIRFAQALDVSTDELLGLEPSNTKESTTDIKLTRRIKKIKSLPPSQQKTLLKTIDTFIKAAEK